MAANAQDMELPATFEEALERLEALVNRLERGNCSLEEAMALFEEGMALRKLCAERLERAQQKIEILTSEGEAGDEDEDYDDDFDEDEEDEDFEDDEEDEEA